MDNIRQEACQLFIEQEIEEAIQQDDLNIHAKSREIAEWLSKLFEVDVSSDAIRRKIQRAKGVQVAPPGVSVEDDTGNEGIQVKHGGARNDAGLGKDTRKK